MSIATLPERWFDTIDAIYTLDGGEHSIATLAQRMGVTLKCMEKRIDRMRKRGLLDAREIPQSGGRPRYVLVRISDVGAASFQYAYDAMAVSA